MPVAVKDRVIGRVHRKKDESLRCQQLWSWSLPFGSFEWTALCFSRCSTAPFELAVSGLDLYDSAEYRAAYELALTHIARARAVFFFLEVEDFMEDSASSEVLRHLLSLLSTTHMPHARQLDVLYNVHFSALESTPQLELSKTMPLLSRAWMRGVMYTPTAGQVIFPSNLRSLVLSDSNLWWTVDEMISILRTLPMLEKLHHRMDPTYRQGVVPKPSSVYPLRCVQLNKLRNLLCSCGTFARNMLFFSYLSIPSNTELSIEHPHSKKRAPWKLSTPLPRELQGAYRMHARQYALPYTNETWGRCIDYHRKSVPLTLPVRRSCFRLPPVRSRQVSRTRDRSNGLSEILHRRRK